MKTNKKKFKLYHLGLILLASSLPLPFIVSCSQNKTSENQDNTNNNNEITLNEEKLNKEINRINNLTLTLKINEFTLEQFDQINDENFFQIINNLTLNNEFDYSIVNLNKNKPNFKFQIQVKLKKNTTNLPKISKEFILPYTINAPSSAQTVEEEINRLNTTSPKLFKSQLTGKELIEINVDNLISKLNGLYLNTNKFKYSVSYLYKDGRANKLQFNLLVAEISDQEFNPNVFTNSLYAPFSIIEEEPIQEKIDTTYFKNNANPIIDGRNSFSTPGDSDVNSVNPSNGPSETQPSSGVERTTPTSKRKVYNQQEVNQLKNTFSLGFRGYNLGYAYGTGWILDYKLTDNNSYPVTWYFGTNAHVIQNLKVPNDKITPYRYENDRFYDTQSVLFETVKDPKIDTDFGNSTDNLANFVRVEVPAEQCKTIFIGNNYLKTTPRMFSTNPKWDNTEEYIDFAVMEVTFSSPEEAKNITQDYVSDTNRHFKYRKESILKNSELNKHNSFSVLGFPVMKGENSSYWRKTELTSTRPVDNNNQPINNKEDLSNLSTSPFYNTYSDKQGCFDAILALAYLGYDYRLAYSLTERYNLWGLGHAIDYGNLGEGASGSMLMDKDGYTCGIFFGGDYNAQAGVALSLYCEGFSYQNKFHKYNLEGYDLINGGFPNQRTSYRENLQKLYGNDIKTKLFPNGVAQPN